MLQSQMISAISTNFWKAHTRHLRIYEKRLKLHVKKFSTQYIQFANRPSCILWVTVMAFDIDIFLTMKTLIFAFVLDVITSRCNKTNFHTEKYIGKKFTASRLLDIRCIYRLLITAPPNWPLNLKQTNRVGKQLCLALFELVRYTEDT